MRNRLRRAVATAAVAAGFAAGGATVPAVAAVQYAPDHFKICVDYFGVGCKVYVEGDIVWYNRTATISGNVVNGAGGSATAIFESYAGTTPVTYDTRTASGVKTTPYSFVSGNPNLPGGINKIYTTLSYTPDGVNYIYKKPWLDIRD